MERTAIVLFNLGGPDSLGAVRPFLFNLFSDPAIIRLPALPRRLLAAFISWRRVPTARAIYAQMGGRSPILPNTEAQARSLETALGDAGDVKTFVAMRYWHPLTPDVVAAVRAYGPARVILLPLYPQFSTATTGSSYRAWMEEAARQGLKVPHRFVCCWPTEPGFVQAAAALVQGGLAQVRQGKPLVLFSAHGLPKKIVDGGDPYVAQVEAGAAAIAGALGLSKDGWIITYQSRVGPLEWVGPATDATISRAAKDGRAIVVFPIAFVSEHSETLVELDIEYRHLAERNGAADYVRVPTVTTHPAFIGGLATLARQAMSNSAAVQDGSGQAACAGWTQCACNVGVQ